MEIERELLNTLTPIVGLKPIDLVLCCLWIDSLKKGKKYKRAVLATEHNLYLFEKSSAKKSIVISRTFQWSDLVHIDCSEKEVFDVIFKDGHAKLTHPGSQYLVKILLSHVGSIFLPSQYPKVTPKELAAEIAPAHDAFLRMFRYQMKLTQQEIPEDLYKYLEKIQDKTKELDFNQMPTSAQPLVEIIVTAMQVCPRIVSLALPKCPKGTYWPMLANVFKVNTSLKALTISDKFDSNVKRFIEAVKANANCKLTELSFVDTEITSKELGSLHDIMTAKEITTVTFSNCIAMEVLGRFISTPQYAKALRCLTSFTLKKCDGVYVPDIFEYLRKVVKISLEDCNVNVIDVLQNIAGAPFQVIKVKGGFAAGEIDPRMTLPKELGNIIFDEISWKGNSFQKVWSIILNSAPEKLKFIISNCRFDQAVAQSVFEFIGASGSATLDTFSWENTASSPAMSPFFQRCPNIKKLNLNGVLDDQNAHIWAQVFPQIPSLEVLALEGSPAVRMTTSSATVFNALKASKSLEILSIKGQPIGDEGLLAFGDLLIQNTNINSINFGNCAVRSPETWNKFFSDVMNRGPALALPWPSSDLKVFKRSKALTTEQLDHMKECYDIIRSGNTSVAMDDVDIDALVEDEKEEHLPLSSGGLSSGRLGLDRRGSSEMFVNAEWELDLPEIPETNNEELVARITQTYTLPMLYERMKKA